MLQSIRDRTHGWIAGTIISLLILSFALWGIHSYLEAGGGTSVAAKVNGIDITKNQLSVAYDRLRRQLQLQYNSADIPPGAEAELKSRALQSIVNLQILNQAALSEGYRIAAQQVDMFLQSMPEFQTNGEFSLNRFQQVLAATLFTANDFISLIKTNLLINQPRLGLVFSSFALPNEVNEAIALVGQQRDINYIVIPQAYFAKQPITISEENIRDYYNQHQNEFKTPEQVSIEYVMLSANDLAKSIHPNEDALKNFYNENTSSFSTPAQWEVAALLIPITGEVSSADEAKAQAKMAEVSKAAQSGKNFAMLAKEFSIENISNKFPGWVTLNQVSPDIQKVLTNLIHAGSISDPIKTQDGLMLLKVMSYKEPKVESFAAAKSKVQDVLDRQQAMEQLSQIKEKLTNITYEHPDSLTPAAQALGLTVKTSGLFTREKGGSDITANTRIREAAFSNDVLTSQNNSDVIQLTPDSVAVIRVKTHTPAAVLPLSAVQNQITDKLKQEAIQAKLNQLAHDIQSQLKDGTLKPEQVSSKYSFAWHNAGMIGRHVTQVDPAVLEAAFEMPIPANATSHSYATARIANGGYAVISLNSVKAGALPQTADAKQQYQAYAEQIQNSQGLLEYELYKNALMNKAKIEMIN